MPVGHNGGSGEIFSEKMGSDRASTTVVASPSTVLWNEMMLVRRTIVGSYQGFKFLPMYFFHVEFPRL